MILVRMLVEGYPLFFQRVPAQSANKACIFNIRLECIVNLVQLTKCVDDYSKHYVKHHNNNNNNIHDVLQQPCLILWIVDADWHQVITSPSYSIVHIEY